MREHSDTAHAVCFCNSNIPWGGGENWHLNAAVSLAARGWRVLLLCHPAGELFARAAVEPGIITLPLALGRLSFLNPFVHRRLARLFQREAVHALVMNLPADLKAAGPAARIAGVRHIIYRRGSALPVRNSALNRALFGRIITRLIVNSKATRSLVLANNPRLISPERITILPNSVDVRSFDTALQAARSVPSLLPDLNEAHAERPFVLGNAGRLTTQKGQHLLLHLGKRLLDAGLNFRIIIAGEGEREGELKSLAAALGLEKHVLFPGFLADLSRFWLDIDLFVLTSLWEGFGNVLIEAGLARKPVFAFAVSNIPELVDTGPDGNGRLFPLPGHERAQSPESLLRPGTEQTGPMRSGTDGQREADTRDEDDADLDVMAGEIAALSGDSERARRMGSAGRRMAEQYSQDVRMDTLEALLQ